MYFCTDPAPWKSSSNHLKISESCAVFVALSKRLRNGSLTNARAWSSSCASSFAAVYASGRRNGHERDAQMIAKWMRGSPSGRSTLCSRS
jgi:hypothetical protein